LLDGGRTKRGGTNKGAEVVALRTRGIGKGKESEKGKVGRGVTGRSLYGASVKEPGEEEMSRSSCGKLVSRRVKRGNSRITRLDRRKKERERTDVESLSVLEKKN